jgi:hypothetical protein
MTATRYAGGKVSRGDRVAFPVSVGAGPGRRRTVYREGTVVRTWDECGAQRARVREDSGSYASGRGYFTRLSAVLLPAGSETGRRLIAGDPGGARRAEQEQADRPPYSRSPQEPGTGTCRQCGHEQAAVRHQAETTVVIEVRGSLSESAFRRAEDLLGMAPSRHKPWARRYVFGPVTAETADALCAFLRALPVAHARETTVRWAPEPAGPSSASQGRP